eukprot:scaffold4946_cov83-Skeletonema_marinoi.AAC.2
MLGWHVYRPSYHHPSSSSLSTCSPPSGRLASSSSTAATTHPPTTTTQTPTTAAPPPTHTPPPTKTVVAAAAGVWSLGWRRSVGCWMSVEFGLENTTINIIIAEQQQQHAERSRGSGWMQQQPHEAPFNIIGRYMCQPNMDGAALTFKCLQRSVLGRGDHWE